jgi:hypothetical protein
LAEQEELEFIVDSANVDEFADASDLDDDLDDQEPEAEYELGGPSDDLDVTDDERPRSILEMLTPGRPLYLIQRSHQNSRSLPAVLSSLALRHAGAISLGIVAPLPRMSPTAARSFLSADGMPPIRIADPECFARLDSMGATLAAQRDGRPYVGASTAQHWTYFTSQLSDGFTAEWVEQVITAQLDVGASVALTPGVWADPATPTASLDIMRQHATWARAAIEDDMPLVVNVTLSPSWLTVTHLRDELLNEIVDMDETFFYIRVRWPLMAQPYGQLLDAALLDGYAELSNVFEENDKSLLLPNSGLTGLMALAWGAHGFSTGIGSGERAFADTRVIKIKQRPRPVPTRRIFSSQVLHVVDLTTARLLEALPTGQRCSCQFCQKLRRLPSEQFDKALAGAHYLRRVGDFTAEIATGPQGRRATARRIVRAANQFVARATNSVPLEGVNAPRHLPLWMDRLR